MSKMIERVALAICGDDNPANILEIHRHRARAAIEAMREPTNGMSRSSIDVRLELYEIEALIAWHSDEKWRVAEKEDYPEAESHKRRLTELYEILNHRKHDLEVESAADRLLAYAPKAPSVTITNGERQDD